MVTTVTHCIHVRNLIVKNNLLHPVGSKAEVLLLLIYCFMYLPLFLGVLCWSLFWYALLCVLYSFAIILTRKREPVALLELSFLCLVTVDVLLLTMPWVGRQCVIVVFPDHTHLLFCTLNLVLIQESWNRLMIKPLLIY